MFNKNKKNLVKISVFLTIFLMFSTITLANTQSGGGGTGIFDMLIDFFKKLIIDYKVLLTVIGALGVFVSVIGELTMPDMARTLKIFIGSCIALAIGLGAEKVVNLLGGTMIDPEIISQNTQYLKLIIGV